MLAETPAGRLSSRPLNQERLRMRFVLGWIFKLGCIGLVYVGMTSGLKIKLPEEILGFKVPGSAQQWVDRNAQIGDMGAQTQASFKNISDSFGKK
jgi:hypothetical protein